MNAYNAKVSKPDAISVESVLDAPPAVLIRSLVPLLFTPPSPLIPIYHQPSLIENVFITCVLKNQVRNIKADNYALQSKYNSDVLMEKEIKYIDSKSNGKSYSTSCHKAIYYCLEHRVPITSICPCNYCSSFSSNGRFESYCFS